MKYKIILEPILKSARDPQLSNPDAARLLERTGSFNFGTVSNWVTYFDIKIGLKKNWQKCILIFYLSATLSSKSRRTKSCLYSPHRIRKIWFKSSSAMSLCAILRATLWSVMRTLQSTQLNQLVISKVLHRFNGFGRSTDAPLSRPVQRPSHG
jgi:hypothetical protein